MSTGENITSVDDDIIRQREEKSDFTQALEILTDNTHRRRKTILHEYQIPFLTSLDVIAQVYDIPFLKAWVNNYSEYRTSVEGIGRQQIVDIAKFRHEANERDKEKMFEMLRGR